MKQFQNLLYPAALLFQAANARTLDEAVTRSIVESRANNATAQACADLKSLSPTQQVVPGDGSAYEDADAGYWTANTQKSPSCIFSPNSANDVASAMTILQDTGAPFAVRGGGHNGNAGWSGIDDGVLISMSSLTELQYDDSSETLTIGFGNRWGQIYDYAQTYNRTVVGGRCNDVGMGLLLGGGLSYLTSLYGLATDNVVSFEVVLANGTIATASQGENPDLLWALRGGGSNFGIVTHATLKTYEIGVEGTGQVWGGIVEYNNTVTQDQLMSALADWQLNGQNQDPYTTVEIEFLQTAATTIATYISLNRTTRPSVLDGFFAVPSLLDATQAWDSYAAFNNGTEPPINPTRYTIASTSMVLDKDTYIELADTVQQFWATLPPITGGVFAISPEPISAGMVEASSAQGGNPIGLPDTNHLWFSVAGSWTNAADDQTATDAVNNATQLVKNTIAAKGLDVPYIFFNEASAVQSPILQYSGIDRLRSIAEQYDPAGLFQTQMPGGFKLY